MARICSSCNKFASVELEITSVDADVSVDSEGSVTVTGTAAMVLTSECCLQEVATAEPDFEFGIDAVTCFKHKDDCDAREHPEDAEYSVTLDGEPDERYEGKGRYSKKFYVASLSGDLECDECGETLGIEGTAEEQASSFDESY